MAKSVKIRETKQIKRRACIKTAQILLKNQHAATARLFLRKVSGIVVVYESGINLTCCPISELK